MEMYSVHQDATMIPITVKSADFIVAKDAASPGKQTLPAISASASKDKNGFIHISIVNIDDKKTQDISININGGVYKSISGRILTSAHIQDHNTFDDPKKIQPTTFKGAVLKGSDLNVKLPPASVVVLELK